MDLPRHEQHPKAPIRTTSAPSAPEKTSAQTSSPFAFVNFTGDPKAESRSKKHRSIIAKYAVLNSIRYPNGVVKVDPHIAPQAKIRRKGNTTSSSDSDSEDGSVVIEDHDLERHALVKRSQRFSPAALLSQASSDPFESLPTKLDGRNWRMLNFWLDAAGGTELDHCRAQIAMLRKQVCFPYLQESNAAFHAGMALMALEAKTRNDWSNVLIEKHLVDAIPTLKKAVVTVNKTSAQNTVLAIILLMTVAVKQNDMNAVRSHFAGLSAVVSQHPHVVLENAYIAGLVMCWGFAYSGAILHTDLPTFLQPEWTQLRPTDQWLNGSLLMKLHIDGLIISEVAQAGLMLSMFRCLKERATDFGWSKQEAANFMCLAWNNSLFLQALRADCVRPLDRAVRHALVSVFTVEVITHPTSRGLRHLSMATLKQISKCDLADLRKHVPEVLLWIALIAGPHAAQADKHFVKELLTTTIMELQIDTFVEAREVAERFVWCVKHDGPAGHFWSTTWVDDEVDQARAESPVSQGLTRNFDPRKEEDTSKLCALCQRDDCPCWTLCAFCGREDCPCLLRQAKSRFGWAEFPHNLRGMLWGASATDFKKMCDIEWFEED